MSETIVDLLQPVEVKEQESELTRRALGTFDLSVNDFHKMAVMELPRSGKPDELLSYERASEKWVYDFSGKDPE